MFLWHRKLLCRQHDSRAEMAAKHVAVKKTQQREQRLIHLISHLSPLQRQRLMRFADRRLAKFGVPNCTGQDLLQDAILALLLGLQPGPRGRHPRAEDLADGCAFASYLRGVLHSLAEAEARRREHRHLHVPLGPISGDSDCGQHPLRAPAVADPRAEASFSDLRDALFGRLKKRCPERLQRILDRWEEVAGWMPYCP
jgi:DNA-directed RNA polymerase specialized sigma24 family protein